MGQLGKGSGGDVAECGRVGGGDGSGGDVVDGEEEDGCGVSWFGGFSCKEGIVKSFRERPKPIELTLIFDLFFSPKAALWKWLVMTLRGSAMISLSITSAWVRFLALILTSQMTVLTFFLLPTPPTPGLDLRLSTSPKPASTAPSKIRPRRIFSRFMDLIGSESKKVDFGYVLC